MTIRRVLVVFAKEPKDNWRERKALVNRLLQGLDNHQVETIIVYARLIRYADLLLKRIKLFSASFSGKIKFSSLPKAFGEIKIFSQKGISTRVS